MCAKPIGLVNLSPINKCLHVHMCVPNNVMFGDMNFRAEIIIETAKTVRAVA